MLEKLKRLAQLRAKAEAAIKEKEDAEATAKSTPQWEAYDEAYRAARTAEDDADKFEFALKGEFVATFDGATKKPYDGVMIEETQTGRITDEAAALKWAMTNYTPAVLLDKRAIEKAAKDGTIKQDWVTVEVGIRAKFATDLSGYLE